MTDSRPRPGHPRHSESVPADHFDVEGCAALSPTLSRSSQRRRPELINENARENSSGSGTQRPESVGTLVQGEPDNGKFDFAHHVRALLNQADDEDIKHRQLSVGFTDLTVQGLGAAAKYQPTIWSIWSPKAIKQGIQQARHPPVKDILSNFNGVVRSGEMLLVLGSPGSGCTTLLKVLANQRQGYHKVIGDVSYDGIDPEYLSAHYRGVNRRWLCPEDDTHFPSLSVKNTLSVAAKMRTPQNRANNRSRSEFVQNAVQTLATVLGLRHTFDTPVGDESIRGVSGGEKKRVSIAEMLAGRARIGCWDNSTRGLDSSTALEFVRALRIATDVGNTTTIVTIYQAAESLYRLFDKVCVIYEGKQIYFGPADSARQYFMDMGWEPANRQTTADFLVAVTDPLARTPRSGWKDRVRAQLKNLRLVGSRARKVARLEKKHTISARAERADHMSRKSAYTVSIAMQVRAIILRRLQIIRGDMAAPAITVASFVIQALIIGSVFYNLPKRRLRISLEAVCGDSCVVCAAADCFEASKGGVLLQRDASKFFIFLLITVIMTLTMKAFFRGLAALCGSEAQAQAFAGMGILMLSMYTGYTIPRPSMIGALKWLTYINPIRYGFEAIVVNEFHGLNGQCSQFAPAGPGYENVNVANQVCTTVGASPGDPVVNGDTFVRLSFGYEYSNLWRNFGILLAFWIGFVVIFLAASERAGNMASGATQLVFKQNAKIPSLENPTANNTDPEKADVPPDQIVERQQKEAKDAQRGLPEQRSVFSWHRLNYDITTGSGQKRRLLDDVSGFVAPGKMTALMGESGAGKTTLLNALAERVGTGVITGDRFVDGHALPRDFASQTGYVQQMDIHMASTTVREALMFSAELRQPTSVSRDEKRAYVEDVIKMCAMESYADAIIGRVGEGLNVEQRKRLTIGVELAAKPKLLYFWTSVDSIHQPSSELFQAFDRLLLLRTGAYLERNGGRKCEPDENPAEYMLDVIGAGATASTDIDWNAAWKKSPEAKDLEKELERIHSQGREQRAPSDDKVSAYATRFPNQLRVLLHRAFIHSVRSPDYVMSKIFLNIFSGLFIGFTFFKADNSIQGSQNKLFSVFMATILASSLSNQLQVEYINLRNIYEYREQQSKMYSWPAQVAASILVELPFNIVGASFFFFCWYWTVGYPTSADRTGYAFFVLCFIFPIYYTTFSQFVAAMSPDAAISGILFSLNGVLQPYNQLVHFWKWMYRLSPFTYLIEGVYTNGVGRTSTQWMLSSRDSDYKPPSGQSCGAYMNQYISQMGGYLLNSNDSSNCQFCPRSSADAYL
ncbi:ABC transporter [Rhizoctonia solani]|uniref:ABC transporter n=1 Tax=Rhizoctonia solani TaxID=456999 RepID=A0A8H7I2P3_9AGAM|nr:ABC transporter [Rhizoctonia solani]